MRALSTLGLLVVLLCGCGDRRDASPGKEISAPTAAGVTYDTRIRWTSYGIPHVDATDWGSLGYGFAYAIAKDAVCVVAREVVTVNGELGRHFGDAEDHLTSDIFHLAVLDDARVAAYAAGQSRQAAIFSRGYIAGYNRYLRDHDGKLPAACNDVDWVRPMTGADLARMIMGVGIRYGLGRYQREMVAATPPPAAAVTLQTDFAEPRGYASNAVAVGRAASATGRGLLLGNPHYPWHGASRFHLIHTTIPGEVDVMGVSLLNTNAVAIGFNKDVAWSHTVSTALRSTLYRLQLDPENPLRYRYGKGWRDIQPITVNVKQGSGEATSVRQHTVYLSHYGPLVVSAQLPWDRESAYAVRDSNLANDRSYATYDALSKATDVDEVEAAISLQGVYWTNTIAADRHGNAFYADISATPNLDAGLLQRCRLRPPGVRERRVVLNGADPGCEWRDDPRSAIPGVLPAEEMPRLKRDDYVANANDSYWLSNPDAPLEGYSPIIGEERTAQSLRTRAGLAFIREQLDRDGNISADELQAMLYSHRSYGAELLLDDALSLCEPAEPVTLQGEIVDIAPVCAALRGWDRRMTNDSRGGHVWREFMRTVRQMEDPFAVAFDPANPVDTPRGLAVNNPRVRAELRRALASARIQLQQAGIALDAPLGQVQFAERNGEHIPVPGGEGWAGMWSVITTRLSEANGYAPILHGNSYIQLISWDEAGNLDPRGILTYSQSPEPESPHYADMTRLYSAGKWLRLPFSDAEIEADPNVVTLRLQE